MAGEARTEKPTPRRLREARQRGDIPTSAELSAAVLGVAGLITLQQQANHVWNGLAALLTRSLASAAGIRHFTEADAGASLRDGIGAGMGLIAPLAAMLMIGAAVSGLVTTRGFLSLKPLAPSLRRLNPGQGVKRLVSAEAGILFLKVLVKLAIAALAILAALPAWQAFVPSLPLMTTPAAAQAVWANTLTTILPIGWALLAVGVADLGYRYWSWYRRLRMTKQEMKEEQKRSEGNPQMRARMRHQARRRLRALISGSGLRRVPQADVVVTNPTHFAVALQYRSGSMRAPKVIAKGQRLVALRIKETARRHNVPLVENKPLAQALFRSVEVNQEIPADLYHAVAQVLAFVYRLRAARARRPLASYARS